MGSQWPVLVSFALPSPPSGEADDEEAAAEPRDRLTAVRSRKFDSRGHAASDLGRSGPQRSRGLGMVAINSSFRSKSDKIPQFRAERPTGTGTARRSCHAASTASKIRFNLAAAGGSGFQEPRQRMRSARPPPGSVRAVRHHAQSEISGAGLPPTPNNRQQGGGIGDFSKIRAQSILYNFLSDRPVAWVNRLQ